MPGPAPIPTAILNARGSWRGKARKREPRPKIGSPLCPKNLSPAAKEVWRQVVKVIARGVLTRDNGQVLARYCHTIIRWWKLAAWLDTNEETYTHNGLIKRHPNVTMSAELEKSLLRMESRLGMTPADRARLQIDPSAYADVKPAARAIESTDAPVLKIA